MPTRNIVLTEEQSRLEALSRAAEAGIADIKAGRCSRFDSAEALDDHLQALAEEALKQDDT